LATAEKTAVVFDADLGRSPVANRATLNGAFAAGLKAATMKVAEESGGDANENIRIVNDALSCADNLDFLGQTTAAGLTGLTRPTLCRCRTVPCQ
jgi:hypothetical protein